MIKFKRKNLKNRKEKKKNPIKIKVKQHKIPKNNGFRSLENNQK
jgi:hypothetical protein